MDETRSFQRVDETLVLPTVGTPSFADLLFSEGIILSPERDSSFENTPFSNNLFSSGVTLDQSGSGDSGDSDDSDDSGSSDGMPLWKRWWFWVLIAIITFSGFFLLLNLFSSEQSEIKTQGEEISQLQSGLSDAEKAEQKAKEKAEKERLEKEEADQKAKEAEARAEEERLAQERADQEAKEAAAAEAELRARQEAEEQAKKEAEEQALAGYVTLEVQSPQAGVIEYIINGTSNVEDLTGKWVKEIAIRELTGPITLKVTSTDEGTPVSCSIRERKEVVSTGKPSGSTNTASCTYTFKR